MKGCICICNHKYNSTSIVRDIIISIVGLTHCACGNKETTAAQAGKQAGRQASIETQVPFQDLNRRWWCCSIESREPWSLHQRLEPAAVQVPLVVPLVLLPRVDPPCPSIPCQCNVKWLVRSRISAIRKSSTRRLVLGAWYLLGIFCVDCTLTCQCVCAILCGTCTDATSMPSCKPWRMLLNSAWPWTAIPTIRHAPSF